MLKRLFTDEEGTVKPQVTWTVIGLVILGLGYWVYAAWSGHGQKTQDAVMVCWTPNCGYCRVGTPQEGEILPAVCPKCKKASVTSGFRCKKCGTPNAWNENHGLPPPTKCVKCGQETRHGS